MKFKQLHIGQRFEFDHSGLPLCHGLEPGPWVKMSTRKYRKDTTPFTTDKLAQMDHATHSVMVCEVGTVNTTVIPLS